MGRVSQAGMMRKARSWFLALRTALSPTMLLPTALLRMVRQTELPFTGSTKSNTIQDRTSWERIIPTFKAFDLCLMILEGYPWVWYPLLRLPHDMLHFTCTQLVCMYIHFYPTLTNESWRIASQWLALLLASSFRLP